MSTFFLAERTFTAALLVGRGYASLWEGVGLEAAMFSNDAQRVLAIAADACERAGVDASPARIARLVDGAGYPSFAAAAVATVESEAASGSADYLTEPVANLARRVVRSWRRRRALVAIELAKRALLEPTGELELEALALEALELAALELLA